MKPEITVYTKTGKAKQIPAACTILDFAYLLHTDIGNHCTGAVVNGKKQSLSYCILSEDQIEVFTHPDQSPEYKWLNILRVKKIRKILNPLRAQLYEEYQDKQLKLSSLKSEKDYLKTAFPAKTVLEKLPTKRLLGVLKKVRAKISSIEHYYGHRCCEICHEYVEDNWEEDVQVFADLYESYLKKVKNLLAKREHIPRNFCKKGNRNGLKKR